ncbi:hypothetical protein GLOIN_2v1781353 [Rhizophagus irregularis DAOM 181602=DAOM 197198]|nr:hypothetical protein GLOIN_2v1781353 [Rhizophagus irregularis DAOM 181602=DAOM 197198]
MARKLFPDNAAYTAKIAKICESYKNKQALLDKLEALFELYYNWQEVRQEAYKRWKNYATTIGHVQALGKLFEKGNIDWISFEDVNDFYKRWIDCLTEDQLYIMEKMLRNGMVVDPQEKETIKQCCDWDWNMSLDGTGRNSPGLEQDVVDVQDKNSL